MNLFYFLFFFFSSRRRHTRYWRDWSSDVCSSDLTCIEDTRTAGVESALCLGVGIIHTYTARYVEPRQNIVLQTTHQHIALTLCGGHHVVNDKVGVLQLHTLIAVRPVLNGKFTSGVVALVELNG